MVLFILICAQVFSLAFRGLQGERLVQDAFTLIPGGINASIWFLMLLIFVLGFFHRVDRNFLYRGAAVPADFYQRQYRSGVAGDADLREPADLLPHAAVRMVAVFLRGVAPPEDTTNDIYRGIVPFVGMQVIALVMVFEFPGLATWLPKAIGW